jgi:hypothetical protein
MENEKVITDKIFNIETKKNEYIEKLYSEISEEEILQEIKFFLDCQLNRLYRSIQLVNACICKEDCMDYVIERIKSKKFLNRKMFFVFTRSRLIDYYNKLKNEKEIQEKFTSISLFIKDYFICEDNELCAVLCLMNQRFKDYYPNNEFIRSNDTSIDYRKLEKRLKTFAKNNDMEYYNKEDFKKSLLNKYEKHKHIYEEKIVFYEYDDNKYIDNNELKDKYDFYLDVIDYDTDDEQNIFYKD